MRDRGGGIPQPSPLTQKDRTMPDRILRREATEPLAEGDWQLNPEEAHDEPDE